jgi:hypothetical protein
MIIRCNGVFAQHLSNVSRYLETLAFVFDGDFEWSLIKKGAGRRPHLFEIKISESLRERLEASENDASLTKDNSLSNLVTLPTEFKQHSEF